MTLTSPQPDLLAALADRLDPPVSPYRTDPAGWVHEKLGEHLWSKQTEIAKAVREHRKVAVKACHGPGKSFLGGRIVGWWIDVHPTGQAFAVTSAPTARQVSAILWREMRRAHRKGKLEGRIVGGNGVEEWKIGSELVAMGRKPADHDSDGFQGIHDRYVLVVLDEACGIPTNLWTGSAALMTNEDARILAIGNPDDPASEFAAVCKGAPLDGTSGMSDRGWWVITISLFETPNFTGEHVPAEMRPYLPSQAYLDGALSDWGEGSPLYVSKVLGQFPEDASDGTIPWSWLQQCKDEIKAAAVSRTPVELGVDVGGSDMGDETVIRARYGMHVTDQVWRLRTSDSELVVDEIVRAVVATKASAVKVDSIGVGHGVVGSLRRRIVNEVAWPVNVVGVNVAQAASDPKKFVNLRAELWWEIGREMSRTRSWSLCGVDDQTLLELSTPKYREVNGRIQVESKDDVRDRIKRSTDNADAVLLAMYAAPRSNVPPSSQYKDRRLRGRR